MEINEYQNLSKRTVSSDKTTNELATNFGLGIAGESGEVVDIIKKHVFHGHELNIKKLKEELGDLLFYVAGMSTVYGFTLEEVAKENVNKLLRRYPNGFNTADSIRRVDVNESR